jgi:hypothetical protein
MSIYGALGMILGVVLGFALYSLCESLINYLKRDKRPKEGTTYTVKKKGAYYGWSGVVEHHQDGKHFMIFTGSAWLCNIKP